MTSSSRKVLGLIPARAGSKSILGKNRVVLGEKLLYQWVLHAGQEANTIDNLVVSTDDRQILESCGDAIERPPHLAQDDTNILDVIKQFRSDYWAIVLLQPTSPFVTTHHINTCVKMLKENRGLNSVQTITEFPHNYHAYNQREIDGSLVRFAFGEEREKCYNKQTKPKHYTFGNLVVVKTEALKKGVFANPSGYVMVDHYHAIDIDGPADLELANWYLEKGKI